MFTSLYRRILVRAALAHCLLAFNVQASTPLHLAELKEQSCSITNIPEAISDYIKTLFEDHYYDRSVYYLKTVENPTIEGSCRNLSFDSEEILKEFGPSNCVGIVSRMKSELNRKLPRDFQLSVIPATIPDPIRQIDPITGKSTMPEYAHVALAVQCRDGIVILDPAFNNPEPIVLGLENGKREAVLDMGGRGKFNYSLQTSEKKVLATIDTSHLAKVPGPKNGTPYSFHFLLKEVKNPDASITIPFFQNDREVLIYAFSYPKDNFPRLVFNLNKKQIEFTEILPDGSRNTLLTFPFENYYKNSSSVQTAITQELADKLRMTPEQLIRRAKAIMNRVRPQE